jgi:hypothetical protein
MSELFAMVAGNGRGASMDDADSNNDGTLTLSPEPVERDETFFPHSEEQLIPTTDMTSDDNMDSTSNNNMIHEPEVTQNVKSPHL